MGIGWGLDGDRMGIGWGSDGDLLRPSARVAMAEGPSSASPSSPCLTLPHPASLPCSVHPPQPFGVAPPFLSFPSRAYGASADPTHVWSDPTHPHTASDHTQTQSQIPHTCSLFFSMLFRERQMCGVWNPGLCAAMGVAVRCGALGSRDVPCLHTLLARAMWTALFMDVWTRGVCVCSDLGVCAV